MMDPVKNNILKVLGLEWVTFLRSTKKSIKKLLNTGGLKPVINAYPKHSSCLIKKEVYSYRFGRRLKNKLSIKKNTAK
jgi:hypothetical protein